MSGVLDRDDFPWWYTPVKWGIPISAALLAATWVGLTLLGIAPAYGMLKWLPAIFASLEAPQAVAFMTIATSAVSSMVGLATAFAVRGLILFNLTENIATRAQYRFAALQGKYSDLEAGTRETEKQREEVTSQYHRLMGMLGDKAPKLPLQPDVPSAPSAPFLPRSSVRARTSSDVSSSAPPLAGNDPDASQQPPADKKTAASKRPS